MDSSIDTIAAITTPAGYGGVGMVRISGPDVPAIAHILLGELPPARHAGLYDFRATDGVLIDTGLALYFPAPASFTGEHVLELHGHGGPVVMDLLLQCVLELGARSARPGEFSERAFLNNKLDLAQAEAIADLVESGTAQAARAAVRSLHGEFSRQVHALLEQLIELRAYVEAALDFPEEEIDFLADRQLAGRLQDLLQQFDAVHAAAYQGRLLRDGMTLVICGRPNAGKSSLLNVLAGYDAAIVTDIPGTTRDVLREHIQIEGLPLHIIDTAGLHDSPDQIEQHGIQRTHRELGNADHALLVIDYQDGITAADTAILEALPAGVPHTRIFNKIDLSGRRPGSIEGADAVAISARTGAGIEALREHLKQCAGFTDLPEGGFSARRRHLDALERAMQAVQEGIRQCGQQAGELLAEELRQAQQALNEITGEFTSEDLLGRIFSDFCIGK
ncbi:MAG: tRNA uridine-5-carboxymethylaminomethyl(34) synthesis GTPase MnmE [Gammaproteobacteria bacterium]|nr:MAG: tRNA uridine-5-carboxymethylaminomethyl(34) synthesis GTPase MnmE [Gammaproteobacteria bacterium]